MMSAIITAAALRAERMDRYRAAFTAVNKIAVTITFSRGWYSLTPQGGFTERYRAEQIDNMTARLMQRVAAKGAEA